MGHWSWFMLPTPPFIVDGVEMGFAANRRFAIRSDEEACAFLHFRDNGVDLRRNFVAMIVAICHQLNEGKSVVRLLGEDDEPKLKSSVVFFSRIARMDGDVELADLCKQVLGLGWTEDGVCR